MPDFGFIPKIAHSWTLSPKRGTVCSACAGQTVQSVFVCLCVCVCVCVAAESIIAGVCVLGMRGGVLGVMGF